MMYDNTRLGNELACAGFTLAGTIENVPYGGSGSKWDAIVAAHIEDEYTYLHTDLNAHAATVKALLTTEEWQAYWGIQTGMLDALMDAATMRPDGYGETLIRAIVIDQKNFTQSQVAATGKKGILLAEYAYPGEYE
jgi:hypothetical protein